MGTRYLAIARSLIALALFSCGATQSPASASKGPAPWIELTSEHFTVWTNGESEKGRDLVRMMEDMRRVVLGVSFFRSDSPARSFVIAFRDLAEVRPYLAEQFIAYGWSARNLLSQPIIVLPLSSLESDARIVTHELTHVIAYNVIPEQPRWFAEGLAGYFETLRIDRQHGKADVGRPLDFRLRHLHEHGLMPTAAMFACEQPACMGDGFYATTWALVTYLATVRPAELVRYLQRLVETSKVEQSKLWAEVFPGLPPTALDRELAQWFATGKTTVNEYNVAFTETPSTTRSLSEADVLSAGGLLRYLVTPTTVPDEVTRALALDGTAVLPNLIAAVVHRAMDAATASSITDVHPDDWRAWWMAWMAASTGEARRAALTKMCGLLEKAPAALPPQVCSPAALDPTKDPRRIVFDTARPRINGCLAQTKTKPNLANASLEMEITEGGVVTAARASVGSPDANACIEGVLRSLAFPPHNAGLYRVTASGS